MRNDAINGSYFESSGPVRFQILHALLVSSRQGLRHHMFVIIFLSRGSMIAPSSPAKAKNQERPVDQKRLADHKTHLRARNGFYPRNSSAPCGWFPEPEVRYSCSRHRLDHGIKMDVLKGMPIWVRFLTEGGISMPGSRNWESRVHPGRGRHIDLAFLIKPFHLFNGRARRW